jgi:hypothetical protein
VPPNTVIDTFPANPSNSTAATFTFHSEAGATFVCSLDSAPAVACSSPANYTVSSGPHTFSVAATDSVGNTDPTPATYAWTVLATQRDQLAATGASLTPYASNPRVQKAIDLINKALAARYWADGDMLTKDGQNVFNLVHDAINNLLGVTSPPDAAAAAQAAIANLVSVCKNVAAIAIQYAIDHAGNANEIAAAQKEMTAAQSDVSKGHPDSATTHYGNAWVHAWKAVH